MRVVYSNLLLCTHHNSIVKLSDPRPKTKTKFVLDEGLGHAQVLTLSCYPEKIKFTYINKSLQK